MPKLINRRDSCSSHEAFAQLSTSPSPPPILQLGRKKSPSYCSTKNNIFYPHGQKSKGWETSRGREKLMNLERKNIRSLSTHNRDETVNKKRMQNCIKEKILPKNLKIIYYGPISPKEQGKDRTLKKSMQTRSRSKSKVDKQSDKVEESLIRRLEIESRYYDKNTTKMMETNQKKMNFTYFKLDDRSKLSEIIMRERPQKEILIYILLGVFTLIFLIRIIL